LFNTSIARKSKTTQEARVLETKGGETPTKATAATANSTQAITTDTIVETQPDAIKADTDILIDTNTEPS